MKNVLRFVAEVYHFKDVSEVFQNRSEVSSAEKQSNQKLLTVLLSFTSSHCA